MSPDVQAAAPRIVAVFGKPDPRPHPLVSILHKIAESGRGLIIHEDKVLCAPDSKKEAA